MNRTLLNLLASAFVILMILTGCGGGGGSGSSSSDNGNGNGNGSGTGGTKLSLFTNQVKACTPYLSRGSLSSPTGSLLADWNSWTPNVSGSVLGKLFDPANGKDESIFSQVQVLDSHINLVNEFSALWNTSGTYTQGTATAKVDTSVHSVTIPYLSGDGLNLSALDLTMDRLVTLSVPDQDLTINMAFSQDGGNQTIAEQYTIGATQSGVFFARIIGNEVEIWCASINESTVSKIQVVWEGDTSSKTFEISECTNASAGNWEVMGGGGIASSTSEMAFMARNDLNDNSSDSDTYYITTTLSGLANGTLQQPINADAIPPNPNTDVQKYITESDTADCFGFLGIQSYPNSVKDLAWVQ